MNPFLQSCLRPQPARLSAVDFERAAQALRCEIACVKAVTEVEAGSGGGFLPSDRPKILFEAHVFSKLTEHRHDIKHTDISSPKWNKALYIGGEKEYGRLEKALDLDEDAALQSASWGLFQIMGFHWKAVGAPNVQEYVKAMHECEGRHLDAFIRLLGNLRLDKALREKRWEDFARGYNGPGYKKNGYHTKLQKAYRRACVAGNG